MPFPTTAETEIGSGPEFFSPFLLPNLEKKKINSKSRNSRGGGVQGNPKKFNLGRFYLFPKEFSSQGSAGIRFSLQVEADEVLAVLGTGSEGKFLKSWEKSGFLGF